MSNKPIEGLEELCRAIRESDASNIAALKGKFVAHNWPMVVALDHLANSEFAAGNYRSSAAALQIITDVMPDNTAFFLRHCRAEIRNNVPGVAEKLVESAPRIRSDNELFDMLDLLIGEGRLDLAETVLNSCAGRENITGGIVATLRARILVATGQFRDALRVLEENTNPGDNSLAGQRVKYHLLEQLLEFEAAKTVSRETALRWGDEHDLRYTVQHLAFEFDFMGVALLLEEFAGRHPNAGFLDQIVGEISSLQRAATEAVGEHGSAQDVPRADIFSALSKPGTPPSRIVWGKQALISFLSAGVITESEYIQFAWFLPNWEQAAVRHRILAAAKHACPNAPAVKRGWLHYLITARAYGDAAKFCESLLTESVDADTLFFLVALLRLQQMGILASFMSQDTFENLRLGVLQQLDAAEVGFRFVMQDHLVRLGWKPPAWAPADIPGHDNADFRGFRRLFAVTTGRLSRVSTRSAGRTAGNIRPILAMSGQLRGFLKAWPSIDRRIRQPVAAPVVMSIWDTSTNAVGRHAGRLERALPPDIIARLKPEERYTDTFEAAYPKTAKLLFDVTQVDAGHIRGVIDQAGCEVVEVETESEQVLQHLLHPHISPNMLKMYYKMARLESLIREAEWHSGRTFSHVIWVRPDCEIVQLSSVDLKACLAKPEIAWSSFVTETSFGDYAMILPRPAFSVLATIFERACIAGDTRLLPWRPNRSVGPRPPGSLDAFGGPDVIFDMLLAGGYMPLAAIPRMIVKLRAGTVDPSVIRSAFLMECEAKVAVL